MNDDKCLIYKSYSNNNNNNPYIEMESNLVYIKQRSSYIHTHLCVILLILFFSLSYGFRLVHMMITIEVNVDDDATINSFQLFFNFVQLFSSHTLNFKERKRKKEKIQTGNYQLIFLRDILLLLSMFIILTSQMCMTRQFQLFYVNQHMFDLHSIYLMKTCLGLILHSMKINVMITCWTTSYFKDVKRQSILVYYE